MWSVCVGAVILVAALTLLRWAAQAGAQPAAPTISITTPTAGATVEGTVTITATATAGSGDIPTGVTFYDGVNSIGDASCQGQQTCTASISWNATGLSGQHSLTARVGTENSLSATSTAVVVTVDSPAPTVTITSPTTSSTVKGTITVSVSAATDPSQKDYPTGMEVYDGVNEIGSIGCQGQQTCQGTVTWKATGLSGSHTLTANVRTNNGLSVTSAAVVVTVVSPPPTVSIVRVSHGGHLGGTLTIVVSARTDPSQADYPTSMTVYDGTNEIGSVSCQGQKTCEGSVQWNTSNLRGSQYLTAVVDTNNGLHVRSRTFVVASASRPRPVSATCHLAHAAVRVGRPDHGSCTVVGVPHGAHVAIEYRSAAGRWIAALQGTVGPNGVYTFTLRGVKPASYDLWLYVAGAGSRGATRVHIGVLRIT